MISTQNTITNHLGEKVLVKNLREDSKVISYDFYNNRVCTDFITSISDNQIKDTDKIYNIKFKNNLEQIINIRVKNHVLFNVDTKKWKNNEKVRKNFCSSELINLAEIILDIENHQCKLISVTETEKNVGETFVNLHTKFNKCVFIEGISISCFPPRVYER